MGKVTSNGRPTIPVQRVNPKCPYCAMTLRAFRWHYPDPDQDTVVHPCEKCKKEYLIVFTCRGLYISTPIQQTPLPGLAGAKKDGR